MPIMSAARQSSKAPERTGRRKREAATPGLPTVSYSTPLIATLAISAGLLVLFLALAAITGGAAYTQIQRAINGVVGASPVLGGLCGFVSILSLIGIGFLGYVSFRVIRDLRTPLQFARGEVIDKRSIGGRNVGNWMAVAVRYVGPDLEQATALTDAQRAAAADRSQIVQPRFGGTTATATRSKSTPAAGSYLPAQRIYSEPAAAKPNTPAKLDDHTTRVVFRVDPSSFDVLESGDEVLIAHSRHLQHIYYVAHLRAGEWESYKNKQII